jgi:hypothetical protein
MATPPTKSDFDDDKEPESIPEPSRKPLKPLATRRPSSSEPEAPLTKTKTKDEPSQKLPRSAFAGFTVAMLFAIVVAWGGVLGYTIYDNPPRAIDPPAAPPDANQKEMMNKMMPNMPKGGPNGKFGPPNGKFGPPDGKNPPDNKRPPIDPMPMPVDE